MKPEIEVERRAGMITGASCGHTSLTWLPDRGRHGTRHGCCPPMTGTRSAASG